MTKSNSTSIMKVVYMMLIFVLYHNMQNFFFYFNLKHDILFLY